MLETRQNNRTRDTDSSSYLFELWPLWHNCPWREIVKKVKSLALLPWTFFWKVNDGNGTASLSTTLSHNRQQGCPVLKGKTLTCPGSIISWVPCPYLTPLLFHSARLIMGIMLRHESIHLSAHLLQKQQRRCRPPMQMDTSLSRSHGVLCSWWRSMPFLGALFHCMNHKDVKS